MNLSDAIDRFTECRLRLALTHETLQGIYVGLEGSFSPGTDRPLDGEAQLKVAAGAAAEELQAVIEMLSEASMKSGTDPTEKIDLDPDEEAELAAAIAASRA